MAEQNIFELGYDKNLMRGNEGGVFDSPASLNPVISGSGGGLDGGYGGGLSDTTNDMVNPQDVASGFVSGTLLMGDATEPLLGTGVFQGLVEADSTYDWRVGDPTDQYAHWDGSEGTFTIAGTLINIDTSTGEVKGEVEDTMKNYTITYNTDRSVATVVNNTTTRTDTFTYANDRVASWSDGTNTWTLTYNASEEVTNIVRT